MKLVSSFRSGYRCIRRVVAWFPVLLKDEDWDPAYLFDILRFKISRMRREIEKNKRHIGYEKDVRDMKVAETLLERLGFSDFYWDLAKQLENEEKGENCTCPEEVIKFEPCAFNLKTKEPTFYQSFDRSCSYCQKARNRWYKRRECKEKADLDYLFSHLRKKIQRWWD
jgi:hypothetical protein